VKRIPILGGLLAALLVLAVVLVSSLPALAQPSAEPSVPVPYSVPLVPQPNPAPAPRPKASSIDDLIAKLADIQARKAALDRAEKETVILLKEKLKQQKERLNKLGVPVEESAPPTCCTAASHPVSSAPVIVAPAPQPALSGTTLAR
jgi:hypothetical protein